MSKVIVDTNMRRAFALAHNTASGSKLKTSVRRKLSTNCGRVFSRGWKVMRGKK